MICIGPDGPNAFKRYWEAENIPFIGLSDPRHVVSDNYDQEVSLFKMGRMPALFVIDKQGLVQYQYYGNSMSDIPKNEDVLALLEKLNSS